MATDERIISARSRNLGFGWTNQPYQTYNSRGESAGLAIECPGRPEAQGGLRSVEAEIAHACRTNSGNDWRGALFVGGRRVVAYWGTLVEYPESYDEAYEAAVEARGEVNYPEPNCSDCWLQANYPRIMDMLRGGEEVRVRLASEEE